MRKVFLETNGYNLAGFIFDDGLIAFDCPTLKEALSMDISGVEGCKNAAEAAVNCNTEVYSWNEGDWEDITELDRDYFVEPEYYILRASDADKHVTGYDDKYITIGHEYYFGQLTDGELLSNACIFDTVNGEGAIAMWSECMQEEVVVDFKVLDLDEGRGYMNSIVQVTDLH